MNKVEKEEEGKEIVVSLYSDAKISFKSKNHKVKILKMMRL